MDGSFHRLHLCCVLGWVLSVTAVVPNRKLQPTTSTSTTITPTIPETADQFCGSFVAELYLLYDVSESFADDLPQMRDLVPKSFGVINSQMPGSHFGLGVFSDKAILPSVTSVTEQPDQCYANKVNMTSSISLLQDGVDGIQLLDGGDVAESQMDAMYYGIKSADVGWSVDDVDTNTGNQRLRVMAVVTDSPWHLPEDLNDVLDTPLLPHNDTVDYTSCNLVDYTSESLVINAFHEHSIKPLFLVAPFSPVTNYKTSWEGLNSRIDVGGAVVELAPNSTNIDVAIIEGLRQITCNLQPTTTSTITPTDGGMPAGVVVGAAAAGAAALAALGAGAYFGHAKLFGSSNEVNAEGMEFGNEDDRFATQVEREARVDIDIDADFFAEY